MLELSILMVNIDHVCSHDCPEDIRLKQQIKNLWQQTILRHIFQS